MRKTLVLVADNSHARIFIAATPTAALKEIEDYACSETRLHEQHLTSDLPGRHASRSTAGHHALSSKSEPKKIKADDFAAYVSHQLDSINGKHKYDQLAIIAAPAFLGRLREHIRPETLKLVSFELDKNLAKCSVVEIRQHLPDILPGSSL